MRCKHVEYLKLRLNYNHDTQLEDGGPNRGHSSLIQLMFDQTLKICPLIIKARLKDRS